MYERALKPRFAFSPARVFGFRTRVVSGLSFVDRAKAAASTRRRMERHSHARRARRSSARERTDAKRTHSNAKVHDRRPRTRRAREGTTVITLDPWQSFWRDGTQTVRKHDAVASNRGGGAVRWREG